MQATKEKIKAYFSDATVYEQRKPPRKKVSFFLNVYVCEQMHGHLCTGEARRRYLLRQVFFIGKSSQV